MDWMAQVSQTASTSQQATGSESESQLFLYHCCSNLQQTLLSAANAAASWQQPARALQLLRQLIRSTNVNRTWRRQQQQQQRSYSLVPLIALAASCKLARQSFLAAKFRRANTAKQASLYTTNTSEPHQAPRQPVVPQHHAHRQFDGFATVQCRISLLRWHCMSVRSSVRHIRKRWTVICRVQHWTLPPLLSAIGANVTSRSVDKYCQAWPSLSLADIKIQTVCSHTHIVK